MQQRASLSSPRQRLRDWALRRQGTDRVPFVLHARRIYILPTRTGWIFAALLAVMFIAGMNYGNGLALLLTFWLTGFAVVAMIRTQRSLSGTRVQAVTLLPGFAGETVEVQLQLIGRTDIADLTLTAGHAQVSTAEPAVQSPREGVLRLPIPARRRGVLQLPPLRLACSAPFGLFRTWTWLSVDASTVVYPRPAGERPVPEAADAGPGANSTTQGQDELAWLRDFRDGDSPRQVAWKAYARGAPLLVREYRGHGTLRQVFDFAALEGIDPESRLSQLTRWVVDAAARGESWELRLPGITPLRGAGPDHRRDCLARLALHGLSGPAA